MLKGLYMDIEYNPPRPCFSEELWNEIIKYGIPLSFDTGEFLYYQNTPSPGIYCVETGRVKVFQILSDASESILYTVSDRTLFGEASSFNGSVISPAAVAVSPVKTYLLTVEKARELIRTNGEFAILVVDSLVHKLRVINEQFGVVSGKKVMSRLTNILLRLDEFGIPKNEDGFYQIKQSELASVIHTTRPNATVLLNQLAGKGFIELKRNSIKLVNTEELEIISSIDDYDEKRSG